MSNPEHQVQSGAAVGFSDLVRPRISVTRNTTTVLCNDGGVETLTLKDGESPYDAYLAFHKADTTPFHPTPTGDGLLPPARD